MTSTMLAGKPSCSSAGMNADDETMRLLERLQQAIISGQHTIAATVATELAKMKANCKMSMRRSEVQLADRMAAKEPIRVPVQPDMTIGDLEQRVYQMHRVTVFDRCLLLLEKKEPVREDFAGVDGNVAEVVNGAANDLAAHAVINVLDEPEEGAALNIRVEKNVAEGKWECSRCTLLNELVDYQCAVCANLRSEQPNVEVNPELINVDIEAEVPEEPQFSNYMELLNMENTDLITNMEEFECPICLTIHRPGDGVVLKTCLHIFCRDCLSRYVETSSDAEIRCPFVGDYSCGHLLQDREIRALVNAEAYNRYLTVSMNQAESQMANAFHCKTANCWGWCVFEDEVNVFPCPVCKTENCLTCQAIHTGYNCQQYQRKIMFDSANDPEAKKTREHLETMLEKGDAMTCPTCHIIILKRSGCDALVCTICKTEICWVTRGPRWGPMGRGDMSGGCGCRPERRCHPNCGNCH